LNIMPMMHKIIVLLALGISHLGEGANIAGYAPETTVTEHAEIDLDQAAIETCFDETDWVTCATDVYANGQNSAKSSSLRTIKGFSTSASSKFAPYTSVGHTKTVNVDVNAFFNNVSTKFDVAEKFFNYYTAVPLDDTGRATPSLGAWNYADDFISDALDATGTFADLAANPPPRWVGVTDAATNIVAARKQCTKKGTAYLATHMYALYEYYSTMWKARWGSQSQGHYVLSYKNMHTWDEGWAFWAGSTEDGTASGKSPFTLGEKRAGTFGTKDAPQLAANSGMMSRVNSYMLAATQAGRGALGAAALSEGIWANTSAVPGRLVESSWKCIEQQAFVPLIQGCLLYLFKSQDCDFAAKDCGKTYGEAYVFCEAILPLLHAADTAAAATVKTIADPMTADITVGSTNSYKVARDTIYKQVNAMGIRCEDVGVCSTCGDDADAEFKVDVYKHCKGEAAVPDHCAAWPNLDDGATATTTTTTATAVPTTVIKHVNTTAPKRERDRRGNVWKFLGVLSLVVYGSIAFAICLTLSPEFVRWALRGFKPEPKPEADVNEKEMNAAL